MHNAITAQTAPAMAKEIWRDLNRYDGYQPFGYDWRTLRLTSPQHAQQLRDCYLIMGIVKQ